MIQCVVKVPGKISSEKYVCRCLLEGAQALIIRSFQMDHMWLLRGLRQKSKRNCLTVITPTGINPPFVSSLISEWPRLHVLWGCTE